MKYTLLFVSLIFAQTAFPQVKPDLFPEDINVGESALRCYCQPGVRNKSRSRGLEVNFTTIGEGIYQDEEGSLTGDPSRISSWNIFEVDLKAPVINRDGFKLLVGYKYESEAIRLNRFGPDYTETFKALDRATMKSGSLSAIISKPLNERHYFGFRYRYSANGNYGGLMNFDKRYAIHKALAVFGFKRSDDFEWGVGLNFSQSFRRTNILPFVIYNRNFRNSWGIETAFPGYLFGRYNLSPASIILFGMEYNSSSYRFNLTTLQNEVFDYAFNHAELLTLMRLEQRFAPWVWGNLRFGYQLNFSTDFESKSAVTPEFMVDPSNGLFFEIGIFISPPDQFRRD